MKIIAPVLTVILIIFLLACEQLRVPGESTSPVQLVENKKDGLVINEVCAKGEDKNEFGEESDWIELYNNSDAPVSIEQGEWTISDNPDNPEKFVIPSVLVPARSFLILWCDGKDVRTKDIHTNFKLSSSGESLGLYQNGEEIELITFGQTNEAGFSNGRSEDGTGNWVVFDRGTPGTSNAVQLSDNN